YIFDRFRPGLAVADSYFLLDVEDEYHAVSDISRVGRFFYGLDRLIEQFVLDRGLDLYFRQEIDHVFRAAIQLGVTFLPAETLDFGDGDALHADRGQSFPHLVKLERLDDCGYEFHEHAPCVVMSLEELELVDALQRGARHVLAGRAGGVAEHRVVRLVPAHFSASFEAVACEERDRCSHFLVLRITGEERTGGGEMGAVLVVKRFKTQNAAKLWR